MRSSAAPPNEDNEAHALTRGTMHGYEVRILRAVSVRDEFRAFDPERWERRSDVLY